MNHSKYAFTRDESKGIPDWGMDSIHIEALHAMAIHCTGAVVEIGPYRGASTSAFIEAINAGAEFRLHLVDIRITEDLRRVVSMCKHPEWITLHETHANGFRIKDDYVSLVMIDADHNFAACLDVLNALASNAGIICMHDTNSHNVGIPECEGSCVAANALKDFSGRRYIEDAKHRDGQWTHRGFLASFSPYSAPAAFDSCKAVLDA